VTRWCANGLLLVLLALASGCGPTTIRFENGLTGAAIENLRWTATDSTHDYRTEEPERLEPGERGSTIDIWESDEGKSGAVAFEMVVGDARVALVTEAEFRAKLGEATTFTIRDDTGARNPLWDDLDE